MNALERGDLLPDVQTPLPGPAARRGAQRLLAHEAPGINTLIDGETSTLWAEALGSNVLDVDGNRFLDLTAGFGVAAIGHRHPRVVEAVRAQAGRLIHGLGDVHAHPLRIDLAERLCRSAPLPDPRVYFAISGADAVEIALKTALLATGRPGVVVFDPSYHGLTLGALGATSRPAFRTPFRQHLHAHVHRYPWAVDPEELGQRWSPDVGAILMEPIVGREGVLLPPTGWLSRLLELAHARGALLIADEIFTGFGRTGADFVVTAEDVVPDLLCVGKALGGGLPLAAVLGRHSVLEAWDAPGEARHTATFVAHPLACAAALAALDVLEEEELVERAAELGLEVESRLRDLEAVAAVTSVRGRGLLWGIELDSTARARSWTRALLDHGLLCLAGGPEGRVLQIAPPLVITEHQLDHALDLLARTCPVPGALSGGG